MQNPSDNRRPNCVPSSPDDLVFIYGLRRKGDAGLGSIRYCGKTVHPAVRLTQHKRQLVHDRNLHKKSWISGVLKTGGDVEMLILEACEGRLADQKECEKIKVLKSIGCNLVNLTAGGEGSAGRPTSDETRAKMRESGKKKFFTAEHRKNLSIGHLGKQPCLGHVHTEEHKNKISLGVLRKFKEMGYRGHWFGKDQALEMSLKKSKLRLSDLLEIKRMSGKGMTFQQIGDAFGVSRRVVSDVVVGRRKFKELIDLAEKTENQHVV